MAIKVNKGTVCDVKKPKPYPKLIVDSTGCVYLAHDAHNATSLAGSNPANIGHQYRDSTDCKFHFENYADYEGSITLCNE